MIGFEGMADFFEPVPASRSQAQCCQGKYYHGKFQMVHSFFFDSCLELNIKFKLFSLLYDRINYGTIQKLLN